LVLWIGLSVTRLQIQMTIWLGDTGIQKPQICFKGSFVAFRVAIFFSHRKTSKYIQIKRKTHKCEGEEEVKCEIVWLGCLGWGWGWIRGRNGSDLFLEWTVTLMGFSSGRRREVKCWNKRTDERKRPAEEVDKCVPVDIQGQDCAQKRTLAHPYPHRYTNKFHSMPRTHIFIPTLMHTSFLHPNGSNHSPNSCLKWSSSPLT